MKLSKFKLNHTYITQITSKDLFIDVIQTSILNKSRHNIESEEHEQTTTNTTTYKQHINKT